MWFFLEIFGNHFKPIRRKVRCDGFEEFDLTADVTFMTFHLQYNLYEMTELYDLIKGKGNTISSDELAGIMKIYITQLEEGDLNSLIDTYIPQNQDIAIETGLKMSQRILRQCSKLAPRETQFNSFYGNSLQSLKNNKIFMQELEGPSFDSTSEFKDIIGQQFYKHLINYGLNGLLFSKNEEKPHRKYTYFHWIQNNLDLAQSQDSEPLPVLLLRQVWSFKFDKALATLSQLKDAYPQDSELSSLQAGINIFADIEKAIIGNQELKDKFIDRKNFVINLQQDHSNKKQEIDFNNKITEIKQQLYFGSNYFQFVKHNFKSKFYKAIAIFLGNRQDNFVKEHDQTIRIQQISIVERFFYAKKFYRAEDFQTFKKDMIEKYNRVHNLQYIVLFGTRKQTQQILQNYIDDTNDITKIGVICVVLKMLVEGSKNYPKDTKISFYNKFIRLYQDLLDVHDPGISKHNFRQKCIAMEVWNKKKTMNKTYDFNCPNCKAKLCLLSASKRIFADSKQTHVRMKGHNVFSKDSRSQVMYCLDCMQLLPKCAVCLYPITTFNGYAQQARKNNPDLKDKKNSGQSLDNALVWCPKCFHGGHFNHIMHWFQMSQKKKCPVYSCKCKCQF